MPEALPQVWGRRDASDVQNSKENGNRRQIGGGSNVQQAEHWVRHVQQNAATFQVAAPVADLQTGPYAPSAPTGLRSAHLAGPGEAAPLPLRAWDLVQKPIALLLLLFLLPLILAVGLAVAAQDGGPVLFAHRRLGRSGRPFRCLKLRTMARDADKRLEHLLAASEAAREEWAKDQKLKDDPRVTRLGRWLRKSSLDELPQLINVLRGEMNLVGPRPIVPDEVPRYARRYRNYCAVKPGITGLWQVSGRNDVSYRRRVAIDVIYARRRSVLLDLSIILRTVPAVLLRHGSY